MIAPAKLHIPNFTIGDFPVQKISFDNTTTDYENYFPVYLQDYQQSSFSLTPVKAFDKYFFFWNNITLGDDYYTTDSLTDPNWTRHWYSPINAPLWSYDIYYGGGFCCNFWDFCYAQNKLLTNGIYFNSFTASQDALENVSGLINTPNFYLYTTNGTTWLTGGLPYKNSWRDIKYIGDKFLMVGYTNTTNPYISSILHSYDGINWNSSNTVPISGQWERLGYGNGRRVIIPAVSLSGSSPFTSNTFSYLVEPLSGLYSDDGINWTAMEVLSSNGYRPIRGIHQVFGWKKIIYFNNKFIVFRNGNFNETFPSFLYSYNGIDWREGWLPDFQENFGALDSFGNTITVKASSSQLHDPETLEDKLVAKITSGSRLSKELISEDGINWNIRTTSFWGVTPGSFKDDGDKMIYNEHWPSINAKGWRLWHRNPSKVPPKRETVYTANFIPLKVSVNNGSYTIDQFGTNNPTLTCHRETNYDFIIEPSASSHPFALRTNLNNTTNQVSGTYNNSIVNGISAGKIMFTPNKDTPNTIYYQCTTHPSMSGVIHIKNW